MTWFKVDDSLAFHPKTVAAGNAAMGLWVRAGSWCAQHTSDGYVPTRVITTLGGRKRDADRLVTVGFWLTVDGGYQFHEWDQANPTRVEVEAERSSWAARKARSRARPSPNSAKFPPNSAKFPPNIDQRDG